MMIDQLCNFKKCFLFVVFYLYSSNILYLNINLNFFKINHFKEINCNNHVYV